MKPDQVLQDLWQKKKGLLQELLLFSQRAAITPWDQVRDEGERSLLLEQLEKTDQALAQRQAQLGLEKQPLPAELAGDFKNLLLGIELNNQLTRQRLELAKEGLLWERKKTAQEAGLAAYFQPRHKGQPAKKRGYVSTNLVAKSYQNKGTS